MRIQEHFISWPMRNSSLCLLQLYCAHSKLNFRACKYARHALSDNSQEFSIAFLFVSRGLTGYGRLVRTYSAGMRLAYRPF